MRKIVWILDINDDTDIDLGSIMFDGVSVLIQVVEDANLVDTSGWDIKGEIR